MFDINLWDQLIREVVYKLIKCLRKRALFSFLLINTPIKKYFFTDTGIRAF